MRLAMYCLYCNCLTRESEIHLCL